jgi:5'-nucleotidase
VALNDFHGQLEGGLTHQQRPVGGAAVLAACLRDATQAFEGRQLFLFAGDQVGASPPISGLLQDEPTVLFLNQLVNAFCQGQKVDDARCNGVATLGNHEFDEGVDEQRRLIDGGAYADAGKSIGGYAGARFPFVCANVLDKVTNLPLLRPYVVREIGGVKLGVIGAVTRDTKGAVLSTYVDGLTFEDEAIAINRAAAELTQQGIRAIFVVLHEGDEREAYDGPTTETAQAGERIGAIVRQLDEEVDVVVTGHAHGFTNSYVPNRGQRPVLVTQAYARGTAFADIDVTVAQTGDVAQKTAKIVMTYGDRAPGTAPASDVTELVKTTRERVAPIIDAVIARAGQPLTAKANSNGESPLGSLIADAQRAKSRSDIAMTNAGGIRAELPAGDITWGQAYAVQPFSNRLVRLRLTGAELKRYLEQQLSFTSTGPVFNSISGLSYELDDQAPLGQRVSQVRIGSFPLDPKRRYTVTVNQYMAVLKGDRAIPCEHCEPEQGPNDLDALVEYLKGMPKGFDPPKPGRIRRAKAKTP